ncbi:MAG: hypothetical protein AAFP92_13930 [Bacteroidota bacterium]
MDTLGFWGTEIGIYLSTYAPKAAGIIQHAYDASLPDPEVLSRVIQKDRTIEDNHLLHLDQLIIEYRTTLAKAKKELRAGERMSRQLGRLITIRNLPVMVLAIVIQVIAMFYLDDVALIAIVSNLVGQVIQFLINQEMTITNYFYGSSRGSKLKNKTLK